MPSEAKPFWTVLTFSATDIAQQLTLVMAEKLRQVTAMSLSNTTEWVSETGKTVAENSPVTQLIEWTNRVRGNLPILASHSTICLTSRAGESLGCEPNPIVSRRA